MKYIKGYPYPINVLQKIFLGNPKDYLTKAINFGWEDVAKRLDDLVSEAPVARVILHSIFEAKMTISMTAERSGLTVSQVVNRREKLIHNLRYPTRIKYIVGDTDEVKKIKDYIPSVKKSIPTSFRNSKHSEKLLLIQHEIGNDIYLISKGVRTCALHCFDEEDFDDLIGYIEWAIGSDNIHYTVYKSVNKEDETDVCLKVFIYKYNHQKAVYDHILEHNNNYEKDFLSEWALGKLLGYSDESIEKFLRRYKKHG